MKIVVFNGNPKKEKSDTLHITRAFLEGMEQRSPQEIRTIHVIDQHNQLRQILSRLPDSYCIEGGLPDL